MQKRRRNRALIAATMAIGLLSAVGIAEMATANAEPRPGMYIPKPKQNTTTTSIHVPTTTLPGTKITRKYPRQAV